jgi:DNA mismatch repair protein MutH
MNSLKYDKSSVESIYNHACYLIGKTLAQAATLPSSVVNAKNRGDLGRLIEIHYFEHNPPNDHSPDFADAGLELKTTGILDYKKFQKSGEVLRAKERLSLTSINFQTIGNENWETSSLVEKCNLMLILFYRYDNTVSVVEQYFDLKPLLITMLPSQLSQSSYEMEFIKKNSLQLSLTDIEIIRRDWEFIQQKILDNKAHELSEGDTFYLGASRKGSGGIDEPLRRQVGSQIGAKSRGFSFKQKFLTKLVQGHSKNELSLGINKDLTFEKATEKRFAAFIGHTVAEISEELDYFTRSKSEKYLLSKRILGREGQKIEEFEKAGIQMKTVSLSKLGGCREDMSFPAFKCLELASQEWEDSDFSYQVETKFLFVVFKEDKYGEDRLDKVMFWNMPYLDRLEAMRIWEDSKRRVMIDARDLPKRSESKVAHVRPHATNSKDVDLSPQGEWIVKRCFWLNGSYIAKIVS